MARKPAHDGVAIVLHLALKSRFCTMFTVIDLQQKIYQNSDHSVSSCCRNHVSSRRVLSHI